ncbi:hypothetical protein CTI12_AA250600 [Artemisia annua]|uniref:Helitron helicase-like domain-containing protein n=1 Tax=Artemisia annua TaxID=35608 RepID=A0A2U1NM18_ARTAN|nr:hypothetical protein CTI12_AA250600 [Artemisia annua]
MKTRKKAVRRVTSALPLEYIELSGFDQEEESHDLHLQPQTIMSDLGGSDSLLNSVNESPCKARLTASELCTAANYREEAITIGATEDGTFSVDYECCYASAMCLWISLLRVVHIRVMCASVQLYKQQGWSNCVLDGCNVQGSQDRPFSSLHGSRTSVDKGKQKMSDFSNEDGFCSTRSEPATISEAAEPQLQCDEDIFLINSTGSRVIPGHVADGLRASGVGPSSRETSQNFATPTENCNVNLPRNDRQRHSQARMRASSDRTQVPPHVRSRNQRPRQGVASGVGPSSHETSQNFATPAEHCNVNLPRNDRQRRSQVRMSASSDRTQVPPHVRSGNWRSRQGVIRPAAIAMQILGMMKRLFRAIPDPWITINVAMLGKLGCMIRVNTRNIVEHLIELLDEHNQLVQLFRTARDKMAEADIPEFKVRLFGVVGSRQHELPTGDSIGAIVFEGGPDVETEFDVVVERHDHQLQYVSKLNASYMSMQFPLLFFLW